MLLKHDRHFLGGIHCVYEVPGNCNCMVGPHGVKEMCFFSANREQFRIKLCSISPSLTKPVYFEQVNLLTGSAAIQQLISGS